MAGNSAAPGSNPAAPWPLLSSSMPREMMGRMHSFSTVAAHHCQRPRSPVSITLQPHAHIAVCGDHRPAFLSFHVAIKPPYPRFIFRYRQLHLPRRLMAACGTRFPRRAHVFFDMAVLSPMNETADEPTDHPRTVWTILPRPEVTCLLHHPNPNPNLLPAVRSSLQLLNPPPFATRRDAGLWQLRHRPHHGSHRKRTLCSIRLWDTVEKKPRHGFAEPNRWGFVSLHPPQSRRLPVLPTSSSSATHRL
ncbi:hypothetical protein CH63R_11635 [Colletotrichum higginsianum IMI 349063]|uniref:Uncharacterized protein n=1 Tax=Colletotrichum higginsianum (strain IMI 349063) TaxID=759273 RepID=A0A1B7XYV2_COLHI|nr:hypothetical protein CH63R_11635 [Colletotrichum higginsianum IMI 349063]OBR04932.1 hypothetical protein CH63R_11635 [Colletotrichum higginsianum IMI 349063]